MNHPKVLSIRESTEYIAEIGSSKTPLPRWMRDIVKTECKAYGLSIPKMVQRKVSYLNWIGGATQKEAHSDKRILEIAYGTGNWKDSPEEKLVLLHELSHCLTNDFDWPGGHTPKFYADLTMLCLKYGFPVNDMIESEEHYMASQPKGWGDIKGWRDPVPNVHDGLTLFNRLNDTPVDIKYRWWEQFA